MNRWIRTVVAIVAVAAAVVIVVGQMTRFVLISSSQRGWRWSCATCERRVNEMNATQLRDNDTCVCVCVYVSLHSQRS